MKQSWYILILFFIGVISISSNIWGSSIYILDEAKNATCAREMLDRGDLTLPTFNGELRTDKPPLHYFFMMLSYSVFGVNEFGARFFSVIAGIGTLLIIFFYTKKFLDKKTAFWAVLILISSLHFVMEFHLAVPDPYLIFFTTLSLFAFYNFYHTGNIFQLLIFYISLGLGVLTKGPVALGLPGLIIILFLLLNHDFKLKTILHFKPVAGVILFSLITLPWYIKVGIETQGKWLRGFFFEHNLERFSDSMEGHGGLFFIPIVYILLGLLPFSVFMFRALQASWKEKKHNQFHLFLLSVVAVITIFFCVSSTKLPNYTMPAYPFYAIILGHYIANFQSGNLNPYIITSIITGLLITAGSFVALSLEKELVPLRNLSFLFLVIPLGCLIAFYFIRKRENTIALYSISGSWIIASLLFFYVIFPKVDSGNPVSETRSVVTNFENITYFGSYNPAFSFYAKKIIPELNNTEEINSFFEENKNAVLLTTTKYENALKNIKGAKEIVRTKDLFERPTTLVYSNQFE